MSHRILVIDFESKSKRSTSTLLEENGFEVISAGSAQEIDALLSNPTSIPQLVVLEPLLPGLDGFELCRKIKSVGAELEPRQVFLGSRIFQGQRYRVMAREAGADFFYKKPSENDLLLAALQRAVGESSGAHATVTSTAAVSSGEALDAVAGLDIDQAMARALEQGAEAAPSGTIPPSPHRPLTRHDDGQAPTASDAHASLAAPPAQAPTSPALGSSAAAPQAPAAPTSSAAPTQNAPAERMPTGSPPASPAPTGAQTPASESADSAAELEQTGEQVLDEILKRALGDEEPESKSLDATESQAADDAIDRMFSAGVPETPGPAAAQGSAAEAAPESAAPIKQIDPATRELLSSIEELEQSVPASGSALEEPSGVVELEKSSPVVPPPPSEEEETLSRLLEDVPAGDEKKSKPKTASKKTQPESSPTATEEESSSRSPAFLIGIGAAVVVVATIAGVMLLRGGKDDGATEDVTPPTLVEQGAPASGTEVAASTPAPGETAAEVATTAALDESGTATEGGSAATPGATAGAEADAPSAKAPSAKTPTTDAPATAEAKPTTPKRAAPQKSSPAKNTQRAETRKPTTKPTRAATETPPAATAQPVATTPAPLPETPTSPVELEPEAPPAAAETKPKAEPPAPKKTPAPAENKAPEAAGPLIPGIGGVTQPVLIPSSRVEPAYPPLARRARVGGTVVLQAVIKRDGSVGELQVLKAPKGHYGFGEAAINAVSRWRYRPAQKSGRPVDAFITVKIGFKP